MTNTLLGIFISHAWKDKKLAIFKEIENNLRKSYDVWVDVKGIDYGEVIDKKLVQAIERSDVVLVLWSQAASESKAVQFEIQTALDLGKIIVPCIISNYGLEHSQKLSGRKYIDFYHDTKGINTGLMRLDQFLIRLLVRDPELKVLEAKVSTLSEVVEELEHTEYRMRERFSGNEHGDAYIQALMEAGIKVLQESSQSDAEKQKMTLLFERCKQISSQYPNPEQNAVKFKLLVQVVDDVDPKGTDALMQAIKNACSRNLE
jgi:TIR domain